MQDNADYHAFSNQGFLLRETLITADLLLSGLTPTEAKKRIVGENLFELRSVSSRSTHAGAVLGRLEQVPSSLLTLFVGGLDEQRVLNYYFIARGHRLLADLVQELLWERVKLYSPTIEPFEVKAFLNSKRDLELTTWSEGTFRKSTSNVLLYLQEARLLVLDAQEKRYHIQPPLISEALRAAVLADRGLWGLRLLLQRS